MPFYQFTRTQLLQAPIHTVWDFIATPVNLQAITPAEMGFEITSLSVPEKMYPGMLISYKVRPLFGISVNWLTEITHLKEYEYFVDEQRVGPYALWHHEHHVTEQNGHTLMTDIITYAPPFGIVGALVNSIVIRKKLNTIFNYRQIALEKLFNK